MVKIAKEYFPNFVKKFMFLLHEIRVKKLRIIIMSCKIKLKGLSQILGKIADAKEKSEP
ncbi:MAG: Unknown protein [uncultured Sulfurovum sp.]|uniref:Uncharacterized protein n=1 Tax=uncultured Sulfurovum sp. TaxID=269237 RepID=A0A6S6S8G9_9BACT|nr:MAG: Unknown protein [uncultured Sulfurovum sp.]